MSIRARTSTKDNRQGGGARRRTGGPAAPPRAPRARAAGGHVPGPGAAPPAPPAAEADGKDLTDERRLRESGGPEDRQLYACGCGFTWRGAVTASAACPHCGTEQAW